MISSILARTGWPAELPALAGRRFDLAPGLNVLFGPDGSGRSTLLGLAAAGAACHEPGWSSPIRLSDCRPTGAPHDAPATPYPDRCWNVYWHPGAAVRAEVAWDGVPALHYAPHAGEGGIPRPGRNTDGPAAPTDDRFIDDLDLVRRKCSTVGRGLLHYRGLAQALSRPPDLAIPQWQDCDDLRRIAGREFAGWIATLPRTGPITLLMDEPDRLLPIPRRHELWHEVLPMFAQRVQVVAASHFIFALDAPEAHIVELTPGYAAECRALLSTGGATKEPIG